MSTSSVSQWIDGLRAGDDEAAQQLWQRYYEKLVRLARQKLRETPRRVADEEDVALSALDSFCRGAAAGRYPRLEDRDDLWHLLFTITERKAVRQVRHETRLKRGGGNVVSESVFGAGDTTTPGGMDQFAVDAAPSAEAAMEMTDCLADLLKSLDDAALSSIALSKMEGYSNEEIAAQLGCSTRTVKRRLKVIRTVWLADQTL